MPSQRSPTASIRTFASSPQEPTAPPAEFANVFFDSWFCENGLPLEIISDRDRKFDSTFWSSLHKISGVKIKMSTSFHPMTDGASERTNKTVVQALRYHVDRNQKGWVRALPRVRFDIMNTVNASTGFSPFQLRMGRSPRLIPPLVAPAFEDPVPPEALRAEQLFRQLELDCAEAHDNLVLAKVNQAIQSDKNRGPEHTFHEGDSVMLNTLRRRRDYMQKSDDRVAKFMPRWDGKYKILKRGPSPPSTESKCRTLQTNSTSSIRPNLSLTTKMTPPYSPVAT